MREIELLREAMKVYGLSLEKAGAFIGAAGKTVKRWLDGENEPTDLYRRSIVAGVEKMRAEYEPFIAKQGGAWYGKLSERVLLARLDEAKAKYRAGVSEVEAKELEKDWPALVRAALALHDRGIRLEI